MADQSLQDQLISELNHIVHSLARLEKTMEEAMPEPRGAAKTVVTSLLQIQYETEVLLETFSQGNEISPRLMHQARESVHKIEQDASRLMHFISDRLPPS
jgi:hypothetical protein